MSRWPWQSAAVMLLTLGLLAGTAKAQLPLSLPPLPATPTQTDEAPASCVPRYGDAGCAARLYAQVLCALVSRRSAKAAAGWQGWLEERYRQAGIAFNGLTADQIEQRAVDEQVPLVCPASSAAIRDLFSAPASP